MGRENTPIPEQMKQGMQLFFNENILHLNCALQFTKCFHGLPHLDCPVIPGGGRDYDPHFYREVT